MKAVSDVIAAGNPDGELKLQFTNTNGYRAKGFNVYYESTDGDEIVERDFKIGNITTVDLYGFTSETSGEIWVVPYNSSNEEGPESTHITVSFETPVSAEPVNDFTLDETEISEECTIGESVSGEIAFSIADLQVTETAADYLCAEISELPEGIMITFDENVMDISGGDSVFSFEAVTSEDTGAGDYTALIRIWNMADERTEETVTLNISTVMPGSTDHRFK